ncbi:EF-hand domain-containing protein [Tateyamaria omphalii]|uniref:EF-hand domain-containing protein n=1 Tax=Tateyamaria omphalii TaxID=299262 RepID=UPI001C99A366|nr:EF-hand domain-containing protein [Tateyamaria omphalii]MBY5932210.1 EF-hand domain-containing protein [Tateyamaria omphalii]
MRQEKKSETLEVRVSLSEKSAFAARAAARGESMSAALRRLIAEDAVPQLVSKEAPMWSRITFAGAPVAITIAVLVSVSLAGAEAKTDFKTSFRAMDANRDGVIDYTELVADMTHRISVADVPPACEGTEWQERWDATPEMLADGHLEFYDANSDGSVTLKEYVAAYENQRASDFVEADADGNGFITEAELVAAYKADEAKVPAACRAAIGMQSAAKAPEILQFLDVDGDGEVSLREFVDH